MNPCGGGTCHLVPGSTRKNTCSNCPPNFTPGNNGDGSQTCVPLDPCTFYSTNPCVVGTCRLIPNQPGDYTCLCPLSYVMVTRLLDGLATCQLDTRTATANIYTLPENTSLTCNQVADLLFLERSTFESQNAEKNCSLAIPGGSSVNATGSKSCSVPYLTNVGDTCSSILTLFGLSPQRTVLNTLLLGGAGSPNPNLDCSVSPIPPATLLCIISGSALPIPLCTSPHIVKVGETCATLIATYFKYDATAFFVLNPGINCALLASWSTTTSSSDVSSSSFDTPFEVCLKATSLGAVAAGCGADRCTYAVKKTDTCLKLRNKFFGGMKAKYAKFNGGSPCLEVNIYVGVKICRPKPPGGCTKGL
eukprot:TRINITY_DN3711_c0_g2_i2.p1 TRINITY_DN3711_c0_g2~~TRINITY_DN3711_c0_g2_i2.p1  ORF type:complete len:362 (-),score=47.00 TRINITY_DN3711_c0_g2_i2:344-1429(-)